MIIVGLDISKNSTGVTFYNTQDGRTQFVAIVTDENKTARKLGQINDCQIIVIEKQNNLLLHGKQIANIILNTTDVISSSWKCGDIFFCSENFIYSFGKGNSLLDLIQITSIIRFKIQEKYGEERMTYFTPTQIKKFATGSGKADKQAMFDAFKRTEKQTNFRHYMEHYAHPTKPIDDIVDSWWIVEYFKKESE